MEAVMKLGSTLAVVFTTLVLSSVAMPVKAFPAGAPTPTTVDECRALIDTLTTETQAVTITGRNADKNLAGLLGKLSGAEIKLAEGKFSDAIQKLQDFQTKVSQLVASGSITAGDANMLLTGAQDAINCISQLG
jgi:hypothetical protein